MTLPRRQFLKRGPLFLAVGLVFPAIVRAVPRRVILTNVSTPNMLWQTTKVGTFNPTVTKTGLSVEWDFGDGSAKELTNAPSHTYAATGIKNVGIRLRDAAKKITGIDFSNLSLVNSCPGLSEFVSLTAIKIGGSNSLKSGLPNPRNFLELGHYNCSYNLFAGIHPDFTLNSVLVYIRTNSCLFTGTLKTLTPNTILLSVVANSELISGYTASTISLTCTDFQVQNNQLPESAVDQIAADFATNIASRPATGTLNVGGTGNAAPSSTTNFDLVAAHGWTCTHN